MLRNIFSKESADKQSPVSLHHVDSCDRHAMHHTSTLDPFLTQPTSYVEHTCPTICTWLKIENFSLTDRKNARELYYLCSQLTSNKEEIDLYEYIHLSPVDNNI